MEFLPKLSTLLLIQKKCCFFGGGRGGCLFACLEFFLLNMTKKKLGLDDAHNNFVAGMESTVTLFFHLHTLIIKSWRCCTLKCSFTDMFKLGGWQLPKTILLFIKTCQLCRNNFSQICIRFGDFFCQESFQIQN